MTAADRQNVGQNVGQTPKQYPPEPDFGHDAEGKSVASWTSVSIITLGSLIMCIAVLMGSTPIFVAGAVVIVLGIAAAKVLTSMGYGAGGARSGGH